MAGRDLSVSWFRVVSVECSDCGLLDNANDTLEVDDWWNKWGTLSGTSWEVWDNGWVEYEDFESITGRYFKMSGMNWAKLENDWHAEESWWFLMMRLEEASIWQMGHSKKTSKMFQRENRRKKK